MPQGDAGVQFPQTLLEQELRAVKDPGRDVHELQRMRERLAYLEGLQTVQSNGNGRR